ncbi:MAG: hypothetical protein CVV17_06060 [Gammaproteobacteria bacterium HGW-Gammaproteobacteria-7]|nr:MAG: hypothetical protein CVV17_06060 [Gammaproteobacteria bacterium HGW-Gammaproteobacteria-7]
MPTCWIIAGPNGAGKTTFALAYLPQMASRVRFINADLIAAGLSPLAPERELLTASRIFLREIEQCITAREDFAFETTLAGRLRHLLNDFSHRLDACTCFMNDSASPQLVFEQQGDSRDVIHADYYQLLLEEAER